MKLNKLSSRKSKNLQPAKMILIVCEGEKTEPNYFLSIRNKLPQRERNNQINIMVVGLGRNTQSLVDETTEIWKKLSKDKTKTIDAIWIVFDKDSFPDATFDNAINSANSKNFNVAWSNEAFELWYILHFEYLNSETTRAEYKQRIEKHLNSRISASKFEYTKERTDMYELLQAYGDESTAIKNAKKLIEKHIKSGAPPSKQNPATNVYLLVEVLNSEICNVLMRQSGK